MKPVVHAKLSVHRYGGEIDDYVYIHEFIDSSKAFVPDMRHRAMLHNAWGCYLAQDKFGIHYNNSADRLIAVRDICEEHIIEDLGRIPTVQDYLQGMPLYDWLGGRPKKIKEISLVD